MITVSSVVYMRSKKDPQLHMGIYVKPAKGPSMIIEHDGTVIHFNESVDAVRVLTYNTTDFESDKNV